MKHKLAGVRNWQEFESLAFTLSAKERGDLFELLTKYYLLLDPKYRAEFGDVWLLSEVPAKIRAELNLPETDQGIDIIARTKAGGYWAVQCKFRASDEHSLTWREISTFNALTFSVCKGIEFGLIAYTGERYAKVLDKAEHVGFISGDVWMTLDEEFFLQLSSLLKAESIPLSRYVPRPHQQRAIDKAISYFANPVNTRGKLIMPCGTGKTLAAFWISEALHARTIIVAMPSLSLIQQTLPVWLREYIAIGRDVRWLCVCSDQTVTHEADDVVMHTQEMGYPCVTDSKAIEHWLRATKAASSRVIFTTYQSGKALASAMGAQGVVADLGILDEAHKTVGQKDRLFSHLLSDQNVPMSRRIFMTATERRYAGESDEILSMDDVAVYGETFELLTFKEALEAKPAILSDYKIITMFIDEAEVAQIVKNNRYLRPEGMEEEIEAQMLAAMIALRKAMREQPITHAVSFHTSIRRASKFQALNDIYSKHENESLESYHVTGEMSAARRKRIIREFASNERALITNARCLTEGVDVPNIDCVLFADPKQSTIDIVQAVGRALRPASGKSFGYIIVPLILTQEMTVELAESEAFKKVLIVLRALASNDERIVEEFRAIASGRLSTGRLVEINVDVKLATKINLKSFEASIQTRVWNRLARLSWRSYDDAVEFVHALGLKGQVEWYAYCRGEREDLPPRPPDIPTDPRYEYGDEFYKRGGMGAWVGSRHRKARTGEKGKAEFRRSYDDAVKFVHALGLKGQKEWWAYCRDERSDLPPRPLDVPAGPSEAYGEEFYKHGGMGAWLGTNRRRARTGRKAMSGERAGWTRSYDDAVNFVHTLRLKSSKEWQTYCRRERKDLPPRPIDIPTAPWLTYSTEYYVRGGMGAWLGTTRRRSRLIEKKGAWFPYNAAMEFVRTLGLKNETEWRSFCRGERKDLPPRPANIPIAPWAVYGDEFYEKGGLGTWLGTGYVARKRGKVFLSYDESIKFVHALGLKNQEDWRSYRRGERKDLPPKPIDVPATPWKVYPDEYKKRGGLSGWLGKKKDTKL